jgi:UDP-3-O-[3-hydroxymyristoyl] N-acetylglucosamine deacetylase
MGAGARQGSPEMGSQPRQTTLARPVSKEGIGLHTGAVSALTLVPAAPNAGIVFVCPSGEEVAALADQVTSTARATALGRGGARAASVEHLLSALYGLGIDNVRVELHGEEVPACDGSAQEWVALIRRAGVRRLAARRRRVALREAVWVSEKDSWAVALPGARFTLAVGVDYGDPVVGRQELWLPVTPARYARDLAPARTFAFEHEVEALLAAGLARGGSEENALVVGPTGYSRPLRFPDEAVRHKAADAVGDLALCGFRLAAHVVLVRPSHRVCVMLARELQGLGALASLG